MKAYKQINLLPEKKMMWGYIASLTTVCFLILISPVFSMNEIKGEELIQRCQTDQQNMQEITIPGSEFFTGRLSEPAFVNSTPTEMQLDSAVVEWFMMGYLNGLFYNDPVIQKLHLKTPVNFDSILNIRDTALIYDLEDYLSDYTYYTGRWGRTYQSGHKVN